jgi:hypothetical protein
MKDFNLPSAEKFTELLEDKVGKKRQIIDLKKIKTYEDICKLDGVHPINSLPYPNPQTRQEKWVNAVVKIERIIRVINNGWEADFSNSRQPKWYIWWRYDKESSGFVFDYSDASCAYTASHVGARFCYETREQCEHVARHFTKEFNEFLLNR